MAETTATPWSVEFAQRRIRDELTEQLFRYFIFGGFYNFTEIDNTF